jgi:hypothetical protein
LQHERRMMVLLFWIAQGTWCCFTKSWQGNPWWCSWEFPCSSASTGPVHAVDMEVFSVAYVSGSVARRVVRVVSCDACKTCLTSEVLLSACVFAYSDEYSDTEQSLIHLCEKLVQTVVTAENLTECMMSMEQHIKNSIDFEWIRCTGCSLHHQQIEDGIVRGLTNICIPWWCKRANRLKSETDRQRATEREVHILAHQ